MSISVTFCPLPDLAMASPLFRLEVKIPAEVFREVKEAGPDKKGYYTLEGPSFENERRSEPWMAQFNGSLTAIGKRDGGAKAYLNMWKNDVFFEEVIPSRKGSKSAEKPANDDLF